jgi:hypothetical protein
MTSSTPDNNTPENPTPTTPDAALVPRPVTRVPVPMGIWPKTFEEGYRLAQLYAQSEMIPKQYRGKAADILIAIELGMGLQLPPASALQSIAVVNGRPALWGDGLLGVIVGSSLYQDHDEFYEVNGEHRDGLTVDDLKLDATVAICTFIRRGKPTPVTRRFSVGQAKKAGLWGKEGPWQTYPDRMLAMRARSFAARDCFPDLLRGVRTVEELRDLPPEEVKVPTFEVRRLSELPPSAPRSSGASGGEAPAAVTASVPTTVAAVAASEERFIDTVLNVESFMDQWIVILGSGAKVEIGDSADALELEKFKGTDHRLRIECERTAGTLRLQSFAIAD